MSNITLLRVNTGAQDVSLFKLGYATSFFRYQPWRVISDKVRDLYTNTLTQNLRLGGSLTLELPKVGLYIEDVKLRVKLDTITPAGVGTYARLCDYPFFSFVRNVELNYVQYNLQTITPIAYYAKFLRDHDIQHYEVMESLMNAGLTPAQRNTLAAAAQEFFVYLKPYWYGVNGHVPAVAGLGNLLTFKISFASAQDFIQTDYTLGATTTILEIEPFIDIVNTVGSERQECIAYTQTREGRTFLIEETQPTDYVLIPSGSTTAKIPLNRFTAPLSELYFIFQPNVDVVTSYAKKLYELNPADIQRISRLILRNGLQREVIHDFSRPTLQMADHWQKHHNTQYRKPLGYLRWGEIAGLKNVSTGSINPVNLDQLELYLEFTSALPEDYVISLISFGYNWINHQAGVVSKVYI